MLTDKEFTLAQIQNWMQSALVRTDSPAALKPEDFINESSRLTAARHLNIYRQSYIARLRECMKNQFSALAFALGADLFQMFADQYLDASPSGSYTLNNLGKNFPDFLERTRPDAAAPEKEEWVDFIIELARFEYELSVIFDAHSEEEFKPANESAPDEALKLAPLFRLFHHRHPVSGYYLDVTRKKEPELPFEEETFCAVTRNDYRLSLSELKPAQYYFLERLSKGDTVEQAKEYFVNTYNFDAGKLDAVWKQWRKNFIASGFFRAA
jgi:hypothetical protein